ncbi:hypothetical protein [Stappia sp. P2PMeth1]|nr:hypothetical protein [Stappia sp. P2PMeth1]
MIVFVLCLNLFLAGLHFGAGNTTGFLLSLAVAAWCVHDIIKRGKLC